MILLDNQFSGAHAAIHLSFGFPVEREETEAPPGLNVGGLDHASAEGACPWSWLPRQHPLVLVAHKHQTHLFSSPFLFVLLGGGFSFCDRLFVFAFGFSIKSRMGLGRTERWIYREREGSFEEVEVRFLWPMAMAYGEEARVQKVLTHSGNREKKLKFRGGNFIASCVDFDQGPFGLLCRSNLFFLHTDEG